MSYMTLKRSEDGKYFSSNIPSKDEIAKLDLSEQYFVNKFAKRACGACNVVDFMATDKFKQCGRCKNIRYCSKACQKAHWSTHKLVCKKP